MRRTILVVNKFCPRHPLAGGAEKHLEEIFSRIGAHHAVHLIAAMFPGAAREETYRNIHIHRFGRARSDNRVLIHLLLPFLMRRYARTLPADVLVEDMSVVPFFSPIFCRNVTRVTLTHHLNGRQFFGSQKFPYAVIGYLAEKLFLMLYKKETVVTVSEWMKRTLEAHGFTNVRKILNGVDETLLSVKKEYAPDPTVLFLGRLEHRKGVDLFLKTYPLVKTHVPNVHYVIAGHAFRPYPPTPGVTFTGHVSEEEKQKLLSRAWLYTAPSRREGYGIGVIEANATGTFVVANDTEGLRESVQNGTTGALVNCYDAAAFAQAITEWLDLAKLLAHEKPCRAWATDHKWGKSSRELEMALQTSREG